MIFISGIISIIIQKNTLGKRKIRAIFLCPSYVNFFAGKRSFIYLFIYLFICLFIYFLGEGGVGDCSLVPQARATMCIIIIICI